MPAPDNVLSLTDLHKSYGDRVILDGVTFGLDRGAKLGLIGANGAGKSTLLKMIAGLDTPDAGTVVVRGECKVVFLAQEPVLKPGATAREVLREPMREVIEAVDACDHERVEQLGGWDWEHRLERAASQAGVADLEMNVDTMSGGQRKRVALARMVLSNADIILLDEPTNHIDTATSDWLERWLANTDATIIVVTHDRYFLDLVVDRMAEVRDGELRTYRGGYTDYLEARAIEEEHRKVVQKRRLQILKNELAWARRSPKARTTKSKARLDRIDDAKAEQRRLKVEALVADFKFGKPPKLGKTILELTSVFKGYDMPLIENLSLILRKGERFGILGPNGCGKSTLLKMCAQVLEVDSGTLKHGPHTKIAWLDQERSILKPNDTVKGTLLPSGGDFVFPQGHRLHVTGWLSRFAFPTQMHGMKVSSLSGGERNRLAIARLLLEDANLLLLDEPTNDIDLVTLNVLEEALVEFQGCVLVVSHDRFFLDKIATAVIAFEQGADGPEVTVVQGDYTNYQRVSTQRLEAARQAAAVVREAEKKAARAQAVAAPKRKGLSYKERQELEQIEARIEALDVEIEQLSAQLADPTVWSAEHARALELDKTLNAARAESEGLYPRWEALMAIDEEAG